MATPNPGELLFDSFASWAPGDHIASFEWSFGDGTTADLSGNNAAIAIDHSFANGDYTVCLKVTDSQGRSDQSCTFVRPGRLVMEHLIDEDVSNKPWQACVSQTKQIDLNVQVTSCGTRIPGVTVIATGSGGGAQGVTDAMGRVTLQVDPQKATPAPPGANTMFAKGSFAITADLAGFDADQAVVELVDCEAIWHAVIESKKAYARWLDRMAGYAALKELIASGIGRKKLPVLPGNDPIGPPEPDDTWPLRNKILTGDELDALGIALGTRVIGDLVTLMELNRSAFPVHELLGLDPDNDGFPKQLDSRLKTMMKGLDAAGRRVDAAGPGGPHNPDRPGRLGRPDF